MSENIETAEKFTALILVTGIDKPGIASGVFQILAPFAVSVVDVEQITVSDRVILTIFLTLNPAHEKAIEEDLNACASALDVDIATLFSKTNLNPQKSGLLQLSVQSEKLHPKVLAEFTQVLQDLDVNIERISRSSSSPLVVDFLLAGSSIEALQSTLSALKFEEDVKIEVSGVK